MTKQNVCIGTLACWRPVVLTLFFVFKIVRETYPKATRHDEQEFRIKARSLPKRPGRGPARDAARMIKPVWLHGAPPRAGGRARIPN